MEYTQWGAMFGFNNSYVAVLILVVMEYTQWEWNLNCLNSFSIGLNPCCNGIYSMRQIMIMENLMNARS